MSETRSSITIIGAGAMGSGIAQVAAAGGWDVALEDVDTNVVRSAIDGIRARFDRLVEKGRMSADEAAAAWERLHAGDDDPARAADADILLEAVVEDLDVKTDVLHRHLPLLRDDAIVATNTSSLSVTALGRAIGAGRRTVGMHFFNPAPIMRLVEIVAGADTDPEVADRAAEVATGWGKTVARAADVPGFIVNHVARPYYLEAFRILEDGLADPVDIDGAMTRCAGFRMGPLALTDLIGQDVNTATTRSVWEQLDRPPLLAPSPLQESLVAAGHLGRKTGRGVYRYDVDPPAVALAIERRPFAPAPSLADAAERVAAAVIGGDDGSALERFVVARIVSALITQARHAQERGVASAADIDTAMKFGVNYPCGPFEWAARMDEGDIETVVRASRER